MILRAFMHHLQVFWKLTQFFKSLGVKAVFDTSCSRDLALIEACDEFITRYNQHLATYDQEYVPTLPMLSSACPGWICYAEKTLGSYILPYISTVRSPQQSTGSVIKHHICWKLGLTPDKVYHVSVMPCYDKKLEASRDDFVFSMGRQGETGQEAAGPRIAEVDSVLTTGEVLDLIKVMLKSCDFRSLEEAPLDRLLTNVDEEGHLYGVQGGFGGYADTIFLCAAKRLFGKDMQGPVEFKILRNTDFREATLEVDGKIVLKFVLCYGFRNLQNIVRKIKTGKSDYHFADVVACPSGQGG
ncbi:protein NAR1 isoform X1 [Amborella trichopoda]|uniref:protein NAR1 isoform X1 n=1 Tax=Amborella trichopoda TaxID=13333 RepID=UPI0009BEA765|nr:protein NAR1 isoform X1 [Amborella trichopoda]|eukprot:XP_020531182.1 protein NAR1 isoform X1 [Amborella trichopoda]